MISRDAQDDIAQHLSVVADRKRCLLTVRLDVGRTQTRVLRPQPVTDHLCAGWHVERVCARVVVAKNDDGSIVDEMRESRTNVVEIAIDVQMVGLDVRHDRDARRQGQKGSIVFIRLDYKEVVTLVA